MKRLAFSDDMMRAIAAGEKTMTRRPSKRAEPADWFQVCLDGAIRVKGACTLLGPSGECRNNEEYHPRFHVGDIVAATCAFNDGALPPLRYRFNHPDLLNGPDRWTTARIMPAFLAPFVLRIAEVRAEKLGDISEQDARREGAVWWFERESGVSTKEKNICAGDCFAELWCHVYGSGAWDDNFGSWVWVYGFEIVERRIP
jgi:hypothetical protein